MQLFLKFFQRASVEMAGDGLRDLFPTVTACISLNVFAAIFPHEHSDIAMRMLHAYTSVALMVAALISANTLVLIHGFFQKIISALTLCFAIIYMIYNTEIVVTGMGIGNGGLFHLIEAIILAISYFLFRANQRKIFS